MINILGIVDDKLNDKENFLAFVNEVKKILNSKKCQFNLQTDTIPNSLFTIFHNYKHHTNEVDLIISCGNKSEKYANKILNKNNSASISLPTQTRNEICVYKDRNCKEKITINGYLAKKIDINHKFKDKIIKNFPSPYIVVTIDETDQGKVEEFLTHLSKITKDTTIIFFISDNIKFNISHSIESRISNSYYLCKNSKKNYDKYLTSLSISSSHILYSWNNNNIFDSCFLNIQTYIYQEGKDNEMVNKLVQDGIIQKISTNDEKLTSFNNKPLNNLNQIATQCLQVIDFA